MPDLGWLIKDGGIPGLVIAAIIIAWKIGREGRAEPPEAKVAAAIEAMSDQIAKLRQEVVDLRVEMTDRLARTETNVSNLQARK